MRLERGAECQVLLEDSAGEAVTEIWDSGLTSSAIVLVLSPDSAPKSAGRGGWGSLLEHVERNAVPPVACVVVRECRYPPLLERAKIFRWGKEVTETLRSMERWALSLHGESGRSGFAPAPVLQPGTRRELFEELLTKLVDGSGAFRIAEHDAWRVAQEFARAAADHFRDVIWVDCEGRAREAVIGEVATELESLPEQAPEILAEHRILVVLDGVDGEPVVIPLGGRTSILATAPSPESGLDTPDLDATTLRLRQATSACRRARFSLELAKEIAGLSAAEVNRSAESLVAAGWLHPLDLHAGMYRRIGGAVEISGDLRRRHAVAVTNSLAREGCKRDLAELDTALPWALEHEWELGKMMGRRACRFLEDKKRYWEAEKVYNALIPAAEAHADMEEAESLRRNLAWITGTDYRPVEPGDQLGFDF